MFKWFTMLVTAASLCLFSSPDSVQPAGSVP